MRGLTYILSLAVALSSAAARTQDVSETVKAMTLPEKAAQLQSSAPAIPRLGIRAYDWWNEGLHGIARNGEATVFPQAVGMAATWNPELMRDIGDVVATEARAKFNAVGIDADHKRFGGLTIWSPNINIFRDPRWGRGQETYGEDPYLTSHIAAGFIHGLQGEDPEHPKTIATVKHLAVHSGPEAGRHGFAAAVSPYDLEMTYLPAFRYTVMTARAQSVMCAYNAVQGVPACANTLLLKDRLRRDWGFKGLVVTDCDAVDDMTKFHFYRLTNAESSAAALLAGTDINCGPAFRALPAAVSKGLISQTDIDQAVTRAFEARKRLGLDGAKNIYTDIGADQINTAKAQGLALTAARQSLVLLKNNGVLPLKDGARIAVVGPNADTLESLRANYSGTMIAPVTPLNGLRARMWAHNIAYAQGAGIAEGVPVPIPETALKTGMGKDAMVGLTGEYFDNPEFTGAPKMVRVDKTVSLDLFNTVPVKGFETAPYGIRWTGVLIPPGKGEYTLKVYTERCWECQNKHDTVKLFIDGQPMITDTGDGKSLSTTLNFKDTQPKPLRLEFLHVGQDWGLRLQWIAPADVQIKEALKAAKSADAVVAFVGLSPDIEGEELSILVPGFDRGDRTDLGLPARQEDLLKAIKAEKKPLIVVLLSGAAVALNWADANADAVIAAWYPGQAGGTAIAETLMGDNNPSGRLPVTFYKSVQDLPPFIDYRMQGRTYRYFDGKPLYGFGYGLSYTTFSYSGISLSSNAIAAGEGVTVTATITNTGARDGDEVAQLYIKSPDDGFGLIHALAGFQRLSLKAGESRKVSFSVDPRALSTVSLQGERTVKSGSYQLFVGGGQPGNTDGQTQTLTITGLKALAN